MQAMTLSFQNYQNQTEQIIVDRDKRITSLSKDLDGLSEQVVQSESSHKLIYSAKSTNDQGYRNEIEKLLAERRKAVNELEVEIQKIKEIKEKELDDLRSQKSSENEKLKNYHEKVSSHKISAKYINPQVF